MKHEIRFVSSDVLCEKTENKKTPTDEHFPVHIPISINRQYRVDTYVGIKRKRVD